MRQRVIGMDIHRTFAEVVFWEDGKLRPGGRVSMTRAGLEGFGRSVGKEDEIVIEATGNAMAVVRVLSPYVARVIVANALQVKAIAHAHVKTDKIDAGVLASLRAADFLPEIWLPDADTERLRRLVARRNQVVRHRTQIKNEVHAILHAHLIHPQKLSSKALSAAVERTRDPEEAVVEAPGVRVPSGDFPCRVV
jgi:transposase